MSEKNILKLAKLGNPNAIADLMNQSLQHRGITSKAKLLNGCLFIFVESIQTPNQQSVVAFIRQVVINLKVASIKSVKVYGNQFGKKTAAWTQEFKINEQAEAPAPEPESSSMKNGKNPNLDRELSVTHENNKSSSITPLPIQPKKPSSLVRNLERFLLIVITFALTTLLWDRLRILQPVNSSQLGLNNSVNSFLGYINKRNATISGGAWVTKEGGSSDILRGIEIVLCKANVKQDLVRVRDDKWRESVSKYKMRGGYWTLNLSAINSKVASHKDCLEIFKTDIEGKYTIPEVPFGSYLLYAPYETSFSKAYWMVPVQVESTQPIQIDLDNSNMTEIYNKD